MVRSLQEEEDTPRRTSKSGYRREKDRFKWKRILREVLEEDGIFQGGNRGDSNTYVPFVFNFVTVCLRILSPEGDE